MNYTNYVKCILYRGPYNTRRTICASHPRWPRRSCPTNAPKTPRRGRGPGSCGPAIGTRRSRTRVPRPVAGARRQNEELNGPAVLVHGTSPTSARCPSSPRRGGGARRSELKTAFSFEISKEICIRCISGFINPYLCGGARTGCFGYTADSGELSWPLDLQIAHDAAAAHPRSPDFL